MSLGTKATRTCATRVLCLRIAMMGRSYADHMGMARITGAALLLPLCRLVEGAAEC
jgi:hypothetical protein